MRLGFGRQSERPRLGTQKDIWREYVDFFSGNDSQPKQLRCDRPCVNRPIKCISAHRNWSSRAIAMMISNQLVLAILLCFVSLIGCGSSPEVTSEEGRKCLDSLYTAVTSKKPELLDPCSSQIKTLETEGHLPPDSASFLQEIIEKAAAGEWQTAATELDAYIREQNPR